MNKYFKQIISLLVVIILLLFALYKIKASDYEKLYSRVEENAITLYNQMTMNLMNTGGITTESDFDIRTEEYAKAKNEMDQLIKLLEMMDEKKYEEVLKSLVSINTLMKNSSNLDDLNKFIEELIEKEAQNSLSFLFYLT